MITRAEFKKALRVIKEYKIQIEGDLKTINKNSKFKDCNPDTTLDEADISGRLITLIIFHFKEYNEDYKNIEWLWRDLKNATWRSIKISELSIISISEILKWRNIGKKTINELKELCYHAGVELQE